MCLCSDKAWGATEFLLETHQFEFLFQGKGWFCEFLVSTMFSDLSFFMETEKSQEALKRCVLTIHLFSSLKMCWCQIQLLSEKWKLEWDRWLLKRKLNHGWLARIQTTWPCEFISWCVCGHMCGDKTADSTQIIHLEDIPAQDSHMWLGFFPISDKAHWLSWPTIGRFKLWLLQ